MIQRDIDPGALVEYLSESKAPSSGASVLPPCPTEGEQEELFNHSPPC
jgi:hypothetical protein